MLKLYSDFSETLFALICVKSGSAQSLLFLSLSTMQTIILRLKHREG